MLPRKWRRIIGVLILLLSLIILAWGLWPVVDATRSVPIQPSDLQLPTPQSFIWWAFQAIA